MSRLLALSLAILIAGCAAPPSSQAPSVAPSVTGPAGASTEPSASAALVPSTHPSLATDGSTQRSDPYGWTSGELFLLAGVADDVRSTCRPADELPEGSYEGIRCFPDGVKAVGFYIMLDAEWMDEVYEKRLAENGVTPESGGRCVDGVPGDSVDSLGDDHKARIGCYVDADGLANARFTLPAGTAGAQQGVYVGVVGTDDDIATLFKVLEGRSWPGREGCECVAPWGLAFEHPGSGAEPGPLP